MKRWVFVLVFIIIGLCGCGSTNSRGVEEKIIQSEINNLLSFECQYIMDNSLKTLPVSYEIERRKTEELEDEIHCLVTMEDENLYRQFECILFFQKKSKNEWELCDSQLELIDSKAKYAPDTLVLDSISKQYDEYDLLSRDGSDNLYYYYADVSSEIGPNLYISGQLIIICSFDTVNRQWDLNYDNSSIKNNWNIQGEWHAICGNYMLNLDILDVELIGTQAKIYAGYQAWYDEYRRVSFDSEWQYVEINCDLQIDDYGTENLSFQLKDSGGWNVTFTPNSAKAVYRSHNEALLERVAS